MKLIFNHAAFDNIDRPFLDRMKYFYDLGQTHNYRFVLAAVMLDKDSEYVVYPFAQGCFGDDAEALKQLDEECKTYEGITGFQMKTLAVLDTSKPFAGQLRPRDQNAEDYLDRPAMNIPTCALRQEITSRGLFYQQPARPVFGVIQGGKPSTAEM